MSLHDIIDFLVSTIAETLHPDAPRHVLANVKLPFDLTAEQVNEALNEAAKANPEFKNWRTSIVDRMKLTHPKNPDEAASLENRTRLATRLGKPDYTGTAEENVWLLAENDKAIQQRGIPLPAE